MVTAKKNRSTIIIIADLVHSSPRIPGLFFPLALAGWEIKLICPKRPDNPDLAKLCGEVLPNNFKIIETAPYNDVYQPIRHLLQLFKFGNKKNQTGYTKSIKTAFGLSQKKQKLVDLSLRTFQSVFAYPDTERAWIPIAKRRLAHEIGLTTKPLLFSSSPYPSTHIIASKLAKEHKLLWVADFRDPWSENHNYKLFWWRKRVDKWCEKRTLLCASIITTVSEGVKKKLSKIHKQKIVIIRNGYLPRKKHASLQTSPSTLKILHTGSWYPGKQDISIMLDSLQIIKESGADDIGKYSLEFYGSVKSELEFEINKRGLSHIVLQRGLVDNVTIQQLQQSADYLFAMGWEDRYETGIIPLKFLEYLGSRKNILLTCSIEDKSLLKILRKTATGTWFNDNKQLSKKLIEARKTKLQLGSIPFNGDKNEIDKLSYVRVSKELEKMLSQLINAHT